MAENTDNGPAGSNKPAYPAQKPANHGLADPSNGGSEVDSAGDGNGLAGPMGEYDSFSNAGGGAPGDDLAFHGDGAEDKTVSVDGDAIHYGSQ